MNNNEARDLMGICLTSKQRLPGWHFESQAVAQPPGHNQAKIRERRNGTKAQNNSLQLAA
jgi:hypothetical protein